MPSVRDVVALPVLASGQPSVVGGAERLDRPVRWVHISDVTDLRGLLEGGELVLSTGQAMAGNDMAVAAYLRMLADLGVAGLVVELGTHLSTLPDVVGSLADALGLPVIALHRRIRYVDVTEHVHRMIVADRYEEVQFARAAHEVFTGLNIGRASPREIVTKASELVGAPVVLEDLSRHVLAFAGAGASPTTLLDGWAERSRRRGGERAVGGWLVVPVGTGSEQWGRLVLPSAHVERGRARMVLERAAQSLLLQRMVEQDRDALLVQALGGLLDDLLTGRVVDDAEASARAAALGLSVSARYAPLVIKVARPGQDALAQGAVDRQVLSSARQAIAGAGLTAIGSVRRQGTVGLLIGCPYQAAVEGSLAAVVAGLGERLAGRGLDGWVAGTAPAAASLVEAAAGLVEAEHVAEVGLGMPGARRLLRSADVRLRGLLALLRGDHRVQDFARTELGRLIEHDARTGDSLVAILRAYLAAGGGKSEAAHEVGLSRPTLYARLAAIERILGVSLDSVESRASLLAAFMIMDANR